MEDNRKNHEKGRGRNTNHTRLGRRGVQSPKENVSPTRSNLHPTKGKTESVKPQGGSRNAKRSQEDHLRFRTREQTRGSNSGRTVVNNQMTGKPKRAGEWLPPVMEKSHSDPIIGSRRSRRTRQNRGTALAENPR